MKQILSEPLLNSWKEWIGSFFPHPVQQNCLKMISSNLTMVSFISKSYTWCPRGFFYSCLVDSNFKPALRSIHSPDTSLPPTTNILFFQIYFLLGTPFYALTPILLHLSSAYPCTTGFQFLSALTISKVSLCIPMVFKVWPLQDESISITWKLPNQKHRG